MTACGATTSSPIWVVSKLAEISTDTIRSWRATLLREGRSEDRTAKAYRLLRAVLNAAVDDGKIKRNPCRIKGAGDYRAAERLTATIAQVYALADRMPDRFRVLVLVAAFIGLRWGELIALRRCDVDLAGRVLHVRRRLAQPDRGGLQEGPSKSAAGARTLALQRSWSTNCASTSTGTPDPGQQGGVLRIQGCTPAARQLRPLHKMEGRRRRSGLARWLSFPRSAPHR